MESKELLPIESSYEDERDEEPARCSNPPSMATNSNSSPLVEPFGLLLVAVYLLFGVRRAFLLLPPLLVCIVVDVCCCGVLWLVLHCVGGCILLICFCCAFCVGSVLVAKLFSKFSI